MAGPNTPLAPPYTHQPTSVRRAYIQNLTDLLHVCLLRRDTVRARRAWSILVRIYISHMVMADNLRYDVER
jgi:hypothetical protein